MKESKNPIDYMELMTENILIFDDSENILIFDDSENISIFDDSENISIFDDSENISSFDDSENISIFDDLKKEFQLYKQTISPKQKDYLITLHQKSDLAELNFFGAVSQLLEHPITDWSDLSSKQISYLINNQLPKHIRTKSNQSLYEYRLQKVRSKVMFKSRDIPLNSQPNYEYGYQIKTTTDPDNQNVDYQLHYLRFYELAMLDYDNQTWETIKQKLILAPQILGCSAIIRFRVYQTHQGYRIFLVSRPLHYRSQLTFDFLKKMAIDPWYLSFYQHHGFKVRVSPKPDRNEAYIAKYIGDWRIEAQIIETQNFEAQIIETQIMETQNFEFKLKKIDRECVLGLDPYLDDLLKIHDEYCQKFL